MSDSHLKRSHVLSSAIFAAVTVATGALTLSSFADVPSNKEAWSSDEYKIYVYKDAIDDDIYWYIPKIRFEAKDGKTLMWSDVLDDGRKEYQFQITPYFSQDLIKLAAKNIPNIRTKSQLKPVVAKTFGISLPDFGFKFASAQVTNFKYLDTARLVSFTLSAEEAKVFDRLYESGAGVNVDYSLTYDGMMTDKFYKIEVTCKSVIDALELNTLPGTGIKASGTVDGVGVATGLELESAFIYAANQSAKGVDIVSKGDIPGMQEMLRRVMNACFEPVSATDKENVAVAPRTTPRDTSNDDENRGTKDTKTDEKKAEISPRKTAGPVKGDVIDPGFLPKRPLMQVASSPYRTKAAVAAAELNAIYEKLNLDRPILGTASDGGESPADRTDGTPSLLPSVEANAKFKIKKTQTQNDGQAFAKQVSLKDTTSIIVIPGLLSSTSKAVEKVAVKALKEAKFTVATKSTAAAAFGTKIMVNEGEQWSINAGFVFKAKTSYSPWKTKQYDWDSSWPGRPDADLYYRVGAGPWTSVNGRAIIDSGLVGGGELQFYIDRSAIFNKIPEKLRKSSYLGLIDPMYTLQGFYPEFVVQVSGRKVQVQ